MSFLFQLSTKSTEYYRNTLNNLRKGKRPSKNECPLNDKEVGAIPEVDHFSGNCICSLCTCGKHICPNGYFHEPYPKSIYKSQYRKNYDPKPLKKTLSFSYISNFLPLQAVDLESTNQDYYKGQKSHSSLDFKPLRPQSAPKTPLCQSTTYANSYMHYDVSTFPVMKQIHIKHHNSELKIDNTTIYKQSFQNFTPNQAKIPTNQANSLNCSANINFSFPKNSTQRNDYKDFSKNVIFEKKIRQYQPILKMKSTSNQYLSTTKKDYKKKRIEIDHRDVSKAIKREGLNYK